MLINALCEYADLQVSSVPDGWSEQNVQYEILLSPDGDLMDIIDVRETVESTDKKGKKRISYIPRKVILPERTQKTAIDSNYIEHRPLYIFGLNFDKDTKKFTAEDSKAQKSHKAFINHELEFISGLDSEICTAYKNFINNWIPENETENPVINSIGKDLVNSYFSFSLGIGKDKLEEDIELKSRYQKIFEDSKSQNDTETAVCGILGKKLKPARLHDKIKFPGGQSSGCQLVCMNSDAFESYGKTQSFNSNVSEEAMKKYTSVFNFLLSDRNHHIRIDDMIVIFFAIKKNDTAECSLFSRFFNNNSDSSIDTAKENEIRTAAENSVKGIGTISEIEEITDGNSTFVIAGFTPNVSRICQKFITKNKYSDIVLNLRKHQNDLCIRENSKRQIYFYNIFKELISPKSSKDQVPSALVSGVMLAALNNTVYPDGLLSSVIRRVKTDSDEDNNSFIKINDTRAGIIKACLNRKYNKEDLTMAWNENNNNPAYLCGGLFAIYEKIQQDASGGTLNRTIKDAYFSSACSRPASIFPKLAKLANNHIKKLSGSAEVYYNKLIQKTADKLNGEFPSTLCLDDQGRFIVGYYQMNQKLYTSSTKEETEIK